MRQRGFAEGESDSAVSATKNDEVPARAEAELRAINPILSKDEANEFKDDETLKKLEKRAAETVALEVQRYEVDQSEIVSIHPAIQVEYPFLSFLELRDGWIDGGGVRHQRPRSVFTKRKRGKTGCTYR